MGAKTKIEWTVGGATWTPIRARNLHTGRIGWHCEHATTGCIGCYAEGFNLRLGTGLPFKPGYRKDIEIFLDEKMLLAPLRWRRPRMIFVCSMTDLFADFVQDAWLDRIFAIMAHCPQHTFQVLTKRAERMRDYVTLGGPTLQTLAQVPQVGRGVMTANTDWPLPNVWLGVSCERQEEADERIPQLLQTPAAVRFISAEPLLGPINLSSLKIEPLGHVNALRGVRYGMEDGKFPVLRTLKKLDWVIVGGESGQLARPMKNEWARALRDQCAAEGVSFFFKQWGEYKDVDENGTRLYRVGKKAAGRLLDGRTWDEFPR